MFRQIQFETEAPIAPEICVEVTSTSNTTEEMAEKRQLYFEQGAQEVWICRQNGEMSFYNATAELPTSELVPQFPHKITL